MQSSPFKVQIEDISPVEKSLRFEIPVPHLQKKLGLAYKEAANTAEVPGFRKGKAPRSVLERYYKKQIESDLFLDLFEESFNGYVEEQQLHLASQPVLETRSELNVDQPLTYSVRIETYPQVEVTNYEGLRITQRTPQVEPAEIEKELERKREHLKELTPIEDREVLGSEDAVNIEIEGQIGSQHYHEKKLWFDLSLPNESPLPGLAEALIGMRIDAQHQAISLSIPQANGTEHKAELHLSIVSAHHKQLPTLDDDFAKDTGEGTTLSELREKIREDLLTRDTRRAKGEMQEHLIDELIQLNPVHLPPSLVQRVAQDYLKERRYEVFMRALEKNKDIEQISSQLLLETAQSMATRDLAFQFLARAVAEKVKLEVTPADVEKCLAEWAHKEGVNVPRLRSQLEQEDPKLSNLRARLLTEKVVEFLEAHAQIQKNMLLY